MSGPIRWVVLFFTRPIHFSDIAAFLRKLKPRKKKPVDVARPTPKRREEDPDSVPAKARPKAASGSIRAAPATIRDKLDVAVSEEPVDTLPAALRDELLAAGKRAKERGARSADEQAGGSKD